LSPDRKPHYYKPPIITCRPRQREKAFIVNIGKAKLLLAINRFWPGLAERIMRDQ